MIVRVWQAEIRRELRDEYVEYVRKTGLSGYQGTAGNLGACLSVRDLDQQRSEIVTTSYWDSLGAIQAFAGDDIDSARYYPEDDRYLLTRPERVAHYTVIEFAAPKGSKSV
jgi:heme-degrading monooxygenase HmoA